MLLKKLLGEILADMGFVTKQHLEEALTKQREMHKEEVLPERLQRTRLISEARLAINTTPALGQILIDMGVTTKDQLSQAMRKQENLAAKNILDSIDLCFYGNRNVHNLSFDTPRPFIISCPTKILL